MPTSSVMTGVELPMETVKLEKEEEPQDEDEPMSKSLHEYAQEKFLSFAELWARCVLNRIKAPIVRILVKVTRHAVAFPKSYIVSIITLSICLLILGLGTNFTAELDEDNAWTPKGSRALSHGDWIDDESGFPEESRYILLQVHAKGQNILEEGVARDGVRRVFDAVEAVRTVPNYADLCAKHENPVMDQETGQWTCPINGPMTFWNESRTIFDAEISSDEETITALSQLVYPNGQAVDRGLIMGYALPEVNSTDPDSYQLDSALSYVVVIELTPIDDEAEDVEKEAIDVIKKMRDEWASNTTNIFRLEIAAYRSFNDEFSRAIVKDLPLIPLIFIIMVVVCVVFYSRRNRVQSQSILGAGAAVTVLLALMSAYGILFTCGVPFSFLTQILPFIMFGIGLDDAFIIHGSFGRTDPSKDTADRIQETMEDIGGSITLTTVTTSMAFGLGCLSSIPAVFWLCAYAFPTVIIDYMYQVTFYVACMALDERRIASGRKDYCCCCCKNNNPVSDAEGGTTNEAEVELQPHIADRIMARYGEFLLKKWVKVLGLLAFAGLFAGCVYSTTLLEQHFEFTDLVPDGSYVADFWEAYQDYYERTGVRPGAYFRWVDQSDPDIQAQMEEYVNDLVEMAPERNDGAGWISEQPVFFWLRDFHRFVNNETTDEVRKLTFGEQVQEFLEDPVYGPLYEEDIVFSDDGSEVIESRTFLEMDGVDQDIVKEAIDALEDQREVSANQEINQGQKDWRFFSFSENYYIWEFYAVAVDEIIKTSVIGVVAVSAVALVAIPHWTAVLFIAPLVIILYIDLLGVLQFSGLYVNSVTYIGMVLSIGLIVDYTYHILLRYVETKSDDREFRVKETLRTIGASVFVGGVSTLLGVVPLAFSSSHIIRTVFIVFIALVTLGLSHGLILLPIVLSIIGPLNELPESDLDKSISHTSTSPEQDEARQELPESAPVQAAKGDDMI